MESLQTLVDKTIAVVMTPAGGLQILIIAIAAILAWFTNKAINTRLQEKQRRGLRKVAVKGAGRAVFPLSMLLYVLAGRVVLTSIGMEVHILYVLTPLLLSMAGIRIAVNILRRAFTPSPLVKAWENIISTVAWSIVALYLIGWLPDVLKAIDALAFKVGETRISLLSILKLIIAIGVMVVLANWLARFIEQRASQATSISPGMRVGLTKFSKVVLYTLAVLISLNSVGIDLTTLTVFGGALGVGLGFGLQRIASNFISGFILLFDGSIKPGDVITIGDRFGWVKELHGRYIVVRDREGVEALIPNENLITTEVTNWSYSDKQVRLKIPVQISYGDNPEVAMQLILDASQASDRVLQDPEPQARLMQFADSGIELELRVWIDDPQNGIANVRSDIALEIWRKFKANNITIPFPQRDVHIIEGKDDK